MKIKSLLLLFLIPVTLVSGISLKKPEVEKSKSRLLNVNNHIIFEITGAKKIISDNLNIGEVLILKEEKITKKLNKDILYRVSDNDNFIEESVIRTYLLPKDKKYTISFIPYKDSPFLKIDIKNPYIDDKEHYYKVKLFTIPEQEVSNFKAFTIKIEDLNNKILIKDSEDDLEPFYNEEVNEPLLLKF